MTKAELFTWYFDQKDKIEQLFFAGNITKAEHDKLIAQLDKQLNDANDMIDQGKKPKLTDLTGTPGTMTPEEYKAAKSAMYQKYKAGEITNYAYIQWKKKNDPALKAANGAVSAPAAKAGTGTGTGMVAAQPAKDPGQQATDAAVQKLEKELKKVYKQAQKEMQAKLQAMTSEYADKYNQKLQDLADGKITKAQFDAWADSQVKYLETWQKKIDQCAGVMLHANEKAVGMVNGHAVNVFADNANWQSFQLTKDTGMDLSFAIYDESTVERLIKEKPELLPRKEVNGKKDKAWNKTKIANAVTQAIIQGESIPALAKRVAAETASQNDNAMMRYARTAMTSAQNSGRIEMLHRAEGMGISVKKVWLATLDSHTRDSHQHMDGQKTTVDDKFSNGLLFPGDPNGPPAEVYNCRCTLIYDYEGFPSDPTKDQRYDQESGQLIANMTYDEWKTAKKGGALNDLNVAKYELAEAQKEYIKKKVSETKQYEGIWKDPVTLSDYPDKMAAIPAKRDYFTNEIQKYKDAQANGASWATDDKIKELQKKLKLLNEFEKHGEILKKRNEALKKVQDIYSQVGLAKTAAAPALAKAAKAAKKAAAKSVGTSAGTVPQAAQTAAKKGQFAADAWDNKTKQLAERFRSRYDADKSLRPELDAEWDQLTDAEKYAIWEYTHNSNPMNKSLSGYHESWSRSNFLGYANTEWGHEDRYRTVPSIFKKFGRPDGHANFHKAITDLTNAIEKTVFKKGRWLVRGSDESGLAGILEGAGMDFNTASRLFSGRFSLDEIKRAIVGKQTRNHAFTSTGIALDAGFSGSVKYEIYAPAGTKAVYAEPQSYYGQTVGTALYKKGQSYSGVGSEAEVILQRGTTFVITDIKKNGSRYTVIMEITEQPDYFVTGDEDTYNGGKTRHKR